MIRTQIQLTDAQARKVKRLAAFRKQSMAEVIRESIDLYINKNLDDDLRDKRARALKAAGGFSSGQRNLSARHDDFLAEAFQ